MMDGSPAPGLAAQPGLDRDPAPAGFNTYGSGVRAATSYDAAKLRHSYGSRPGSCGFPPRTASLGQTQAGTYTRPLLSST